jgi:penicillin-binding protein 1B
MKPRLLNPGLVSVAKLRLTDRMGRRRSRLSSLIRASRRPTLLRSVGILTLVFAMTLGITVVYLFRQVDEAFGKKEDVLATRIYSDVIPLQPGLPRPWIEARLRALGYASEPTTSLAGNTLQLKLHQRNYPELLVPEDHPTRNLLGKTIRVLFDSNQRDAVVQAVQTDEGREVPEIFLEPELVATLSRTVDGKEQRQIRSYALFDTIPHGIKAAVMAAEDQHFMDHPGIDPRGILRAVWVNLRSGALKQGGSTITLQLVKNLIERRGKNVFLKLNEIFIALILEARYDKTQILERYLNEVYLGQAGGLEVHGVVEGARLFFGKTLEQLTIAEMALMAGLIRGPAYYNPYRHPKRAVDRQRWVLGRMVETGLLARAEAEIAQREPLQLEPPQTATNKAPYFVDFVKAELLNELKDRFTEDQVLEMGLNIYTSIDLHANQIGQRAIQEGAAALEKKLGEALTDEGGATPRIEGALAAVEHGTGMIRALVGGRNYSESSFNRILNMKRQAGSTFKPALYLAALLKGVDAKGTPYSGGYPLEDAPWKLKYDRGRQEWAPKNYEKGFKGWISLREALAESVNTVAGRLGSELGPEAIIEAARALGFDSELPEVPSLALGSAEVSPIEILRAYATLAARGARDELTTIRVITEDDGALLKRWIHRPTERIPPLTADLMTDLLQSVFTEGTAQGAAALGFDRPAAGKTGTTNDSRDAWFAGYTPQLTTVVWVGMDQGVVPDPKASPLPREKKRKKKKTATFKLTGATGALPIWVRFMSETLAGDPPLPFPLSPELVPIRVDRRTGLRATEDCPDSQTRIEKFLPGQEPASTTCESTFPSR